MAAREPHAQPVAPIDRELFWSSLRARHPRLRIALVEDARVTAAHRGERSEFRSRADTAAQIARLSWVSDAFLAQVLYRVKARAQARGIPGIPRLAHRLAMMLAQVSIGDPVTLAPGAYIVHGQVVIDGLVEIGAEAVISPFVTIGLRAGDVRGPTIGERVNIGTGRRSSALSRSVPPRLSAPERSSSTTSPPEQPWLVSRRDRSPTPGPEGAGQFRREPEC